MGSPEKLATMERGSSMTSVEGRVGTAPIEFLNPAAQFSVGTLIRSDEQLRSVGIALEPPKRANGAKPTIHPFIYAGHIGQFAKNLEVRSRFEPETMDPHTIVESQTWTHEEVWELGEEPIDEELMRDFGNVRRLYKDGDTFKYGPSLIIEEDDVTFAERKSGVWIPYSLVSDAWHLEFARLV